MPTRTLVTAALPYANGDIHLGHLVEYLMADIFVRFRKLRGDRCIYICADDTHGTAIMIRARKEGITEEELIARMNAAHQRDFQAFDIAFDHYGSTHSPANRQVCHEFWAALRRADLIRQRSVEQLFDPEAGTFLADRFVVGQCPKCQAADQYGDSCEICGANYSPADLIGARSTLSGAKPVLRTSDHLLVELERMHGFLTGWVGTPGHLQPEVANYLRGHFLHEPLRDWDVSRPAPYFGFEIPDAPGHYWYVWFDAPIGYLGATADWCARSGEDFLAWWRSPDTEIRHFIGKDIIYFHTLFWPAMLEVAGFNRPTRVQVHGFLTVDGAKMSKARGTFITAATCANHLDPQALRYYYATKLGPGIDDPDLNLDEFAARVNADLVGKVVNLASRTAKFVEKTGLSSTYPDDGGRFAQAAAEGASIAAAYEACDYSQAMRRIMALADRANEYVESAAPWTLRKDPARSQALRDACTVALNLFRQLAIYLAPVLPRLAEHTGRLLGQTIRTWDEAGQPLIGSSVAPFEHLMHRIDPASVKALVEEGRTQAPTTPPTPPAASLTQGAAKVGWQHAGARAFPATQEGGAPGGPIFEAPCNLPPSPPIAPTITLDDFQKIDLRVAQVLEAAEVPEAGKLLRLVVSLGALGQRTVFAGLKGIYKPEDLVGRLVVVVANLAARQMRFGTSEGMVVAAGPGAPHLFLLAPDSGAKPGMRLG